ncbi:hypothetical protein BJX68DRAFT_268002 [Aspergillus pseudodeflectus]|uniref:Uncharacterized protein n=1 Tax=Aspergillus pseudodeflectus TaxID=176178 RepID=A0ABR4K5N2_9EURO
MALTHRDYTVAWICALPIEMAAAKLMLETFHPRLSQPQTDHNVYTLGSISGHNIVIACLPSGVYGITSAAIVLDQMLSTFPQLRSGLMVGVGGGVPGPGKTDIRLGDVVVSMPTSGSTLGGVVQYDYGKTLHYGTFQQTGSLNKPPRYLLTAISQMRSEDLIGDISSRIEQTISDVLASKEPKVRDQFSRPDDDWLFKSSYHHHRSDDADCSACDHTQLVFREPRGSKNPVIHYGLIASGNQVMKDPVRRDALAREMDILCFEMEAAGLVDQLSCLVIRGICDYCDSHKHKKWQGYAALTAAAYTKALLNVVPSQDRKEPACQGWVSPSPSNLERIKDILQPSVHPLDTFQNIGKRRVPGTADWVRNEPLFRAWAECNDSPVLWVSGTPGCGKSFIAQNIIAHFLERFPQCDATRQNRTSVGYFFFRHNDPETRKFHRALRDVAFQIYQNDPSYRDYIHAHCHSADDIKSIHAAWRVLFMDNYYNSLPKGESSVVLVIDGVDEAFEDDCREFLRLVSDVVHNPAKCRLKLVLLGRPDIYDDLVEAFEQPVPTIHVNADKNTGDITTYVKRSIRKSRQMSRIPKTQRLTIEEALITKAEELNGKTRAGSMLESLHKAPKGLDAMLRHVLETFSGRLNDEEAIDLNIILAWVACADRPLSLRELDEILNVELETHDDRLALEDALRTQYASLFVLNREDGFTTADLVGGANRGVNQPRNDESAGNSDSSSEPDPEPEFNSEPHTTRVVFCHASIRDFLRNPDYGKVSAGDDSTPVGVDIVQASLSTLKMCLLAIAKGPLGSSVRDYALRYWVSQLRHLCQYLDKINRQQRQEIILLLCTILRGANLELLYTYAAPEPVIELINGETMTLIMSLFADEECVNTIDDTETRQWIRLCLEEPAQVFVPLGLEVAERWLIDSWDPAVFCMEIVLAVIVLLGEDPPELTERPSAETVLEVARWAQYEENAIWHHQVGACLSSLEHYDAAIEHLTAALALEPLWRTKLDLAEVYWKRDCLNDSLRLFRECEANYAPPLTTPRTKHKFDPVKEKSRDLAKLRVRMGVLYIQLGDHSSATKLLMESIRLWDSRYVCTAVYLVIRVLVASESARHESIMQVLKMIDLHPWSYIETVLFKVLECNYIGWHNWDNTQLLLVFAVSAKRCDDLPWLECKYQTLIEGNSHYPDTAICLNETLAHLYDRFLGDESKAILIWKSIIAQRKVPDSPWYETFCRTRNRAVAAYGYRLLTNCLRETGNAQSLLVWELEKLCDAEIQSPSCNHVLFDGQPGVYMGIWHRLKGREHEARNYFKPYVLQAVSWRDGESSKPVMHLQRILGHLFAMIGDDEDAITLLQHVHSPLDLRDGTSATPEERMASPWPLVVEDRVWYCHICLRSWGNFVNCNVCRRCRADICEECIDSVKLGDPEISYACDASHEWLKIPAPPGVPGTYPLSRGGKTLSIEEYMKAVERDWM